MIGVQTFKLKAMTEQFFMYPVHFSLLPSPHPVCILMPSGSHPIYVAEQHEGKFPVNFWRETHTVSAEWELDLVIQLEIVA